MSQLHKLLHFHLITSSSRTHRLFNSLNFCGSIVSGAENLLLSRQCYGRLRESRNRRAHIWMAGNGEEPNVFRRAHNWMAGNGEEPNVFKREHNWMPGNGEEPSKKRPRLENEAKGSDTNPTEEEKRINRHVSIHGMISSNNSIVTRAKASEIRNSISKLNNIQHHAIDRPLINCPTTKQIWREFKDKLENSLRKHLRELIENDFNGLEHGLEIVDSLYLLKLFNISKPEFEAFVQKAEDGEKKLREGLEQAKEGFNKLKLAVSDALESST